MRELMLGTRKNISLLIGILESILIHKRLSPPLIPPNHLLKMNSMNSNNPQKEVIMEFLARHFANHNKTLSKFNLQ